MVLLVATNSTLIFLAGRRQPATHLALQESVRNGQRNYAPGDLSRLRGLRNFTLEPNPEVSSSVRFLCGPLAYYVGLMVSIGWLL